MMKRLVLSLAILVAPVLLSAQIGVDASPLSPVTGPIRSSEVRRADTTRAKDTIAPAMSVDDAQSVYAKADRYYGRSNWSSSEFDSVMKSTGIDSRDGQHAAIASILLRMRDGDEQGARDRLDTLFSMPGYVIDNDIAQILSAIDVILNTSNRVDTVFIETKAPPSPNQQTPSDPAGQGRAAIAPNKPNTMASSMPKNADSTRWASDSLVQLAAATAKKSADSTRSPADSLAQVTSATPKSQSQPMNTNAQPIQGTNGMTAQQATDPSANALAALEARLRALEGKVNALSVKDTSPDVDSQAENVDVEAEGEYEPSPTTRFTNEWPEEYITRRCYTIEIERHAIRDVAERQIATLRKIYKRARLAIDMTSDRPFVVIVGYYQTERSAVGDIPMVSRTTRRACKVMETTIAEKL